MSEKVWFVTGAGRGLGLLITRHALETGDRVVATSRSVNDIAAALSGLSDEVLRDKLLLYKLDVTDAKCAVSATKAAIKKFGRIDVLVNNAGRAQLGWFETINEAEVRRQFDINFFGAMNVARAILPHMRARRSGLLVTISSVNGLVSNAGGSVYSASKFALEGWVEGLAEEIAPLGIQSLIVEPGMMRTNFLDSSTARQGSLNISDYSEAIADFRAFIIEANGNQENDPDDLAKVIVAEATKRSPASRLLFGRDAHIWASEKIQSLTAQIKASNSSD